MNPEITLQLVESVLGKVVDNANESHRRSLVSGVNNENPAWACDVARRVVESGIRAEALARITEKTAFAMVHSDGYDGVKLQQQVTKTGIDKLRHLIAKLEQECEMFEAWAAETVDSMARLAQKTIDRLA